MTLFQIILDGNILKLNSLRQQEMFSLVFFQIWFYVLFFSPGPKLQLILIIFGLSKGKVDADNESLAMPVILLETVLFH